MSAHTKGPWTLDKSRMVLGPCFTGELKAICEAVRGGNKDEANANARLIASAPDLHALLLEWHALGKVMRETNDVEDLMARTASVLGKIA